MRIVTTLIEGPTSRDVVIDASGGVTVSQLSRAFERASGEKLTVDGRVMDGAVTLADARLHTGAVISSSADRQDSDSLGLVDLGVAGGPGAGRIVRLGPGEHLLGGSRGDVLVAGIPNGALVIRVDPRSRVSVRVGAPGLAVTIGDVEVRESFTEWPPDRLLHVGPCLLQQRAVREADAVLEYDAETGSFDFNRPPRITAPEPEGTFRIPVGPQMLSGNTLPWLAAAAPLLIGGVMALVLKSPAFLAFAALSPLVVVANSISAKRQGRKSFRSKVEEHRALVARIEADVANRRRAEGAAAVASAPSAATLRVIATAPESQLWERRPGDTDHLLVRVGTADVVSRVVVEDLREVLEYQRRAPALLQDMPATVRLDEAGVIGIAGTARRAINTASWMLGQLAVLQSPKDLVAVLLATDGGPRWAWTSWLPHLTVAASPNARALVGNDAETIGRRVAELAQLIADRQALRRVGSNRDRLGPDVVVVFDGAHKLRAYPGVPAILRDGPEVGVYSICVDGAERSLPEECGAVIVHRPDGSAVLRRSRQEAVQGIVADEVDEPWFEKVARALGPIRDIGEDADEAIPNTARLTEVLAIEPVSAEQIGARWSGTGRSTSVVVGIGLDGPFSIDLVADGPHGLIAGTTGSGKSEFLQTLVASLAVSNRPDAMNFVLVDYKGGAAFKDAVRLPHTVGMVTDLDAHLVERALVSLGAELTRREHVLAAADAKDIDEYLDLRERDPDMVAMPRLLIVIDEFASMARELPDFVPGLVNIAQRGRSLGIHLVLATQRPSGVVSGDIRANTNLRVALRVTDTADSTDVIDSPDAARIAASMPGRALVRRGHASLVPFQTARVGGRSLGADGFLDGQPFVATLSWSAAGYPLPAPAHPETADDELTDLRRVVDAARLAADRLSLPPNHSPWLPPLSNRILLQTLAEAASGGSPSSDDARLPAVPWALADAPQSQAQDPVLLDVSTFGHMFVVGAARSGRSQALRTIAASLADRISAIDLHLFGIDMGNGALLPLSHLPHTGAVVQRSERDRLVRLLDRLQEELTRRQELFGQLGVADLGEQRRSSKDGDALPHLVIFIDRWESYVSTYGDQDAGALVERVHVLLREGASAGIHVVIAGDRTLLSGRISVLTEDKWMLRPADRTDFTMIGLNPRKLPENIGDGRAFRAGTGLEAQIGLLSPDPSAAAQSEAIALIGARAKARDGVLPPNRRPLRIDVLPTNLAEEDIAEFPEPAHGTPWIRVGIGGDELELVGADLGTGPASFLVAGPPRSGRSTALQGIVRSLIADGTAVVLLCPRPSPLLEVFRGAAGVRAVVDRADISPEELAGHLSGSEPLVLVIDDSELMRDAPAKDVVRMFLRDAPGRGRALVVAGNAAEIGGGFGGWHTDVKNAHRGALLSPRNVFDGDLVGLRLSRSVTGLPITPGRALVNLGDDVPRVVQIPRPPETSAA